MSKFLMLGNKLVNTDAITYVDYAGSDGDGHDRIVIHLTGGDMVRLLPDTTAATRLQDWCGANLIEVVKLPVAPAPNIIEPADTEATERIKKLEEALQRATVKSELQVIAVGNTFAIARDPSTQMYNVEDLDGWTVAAFAKQDEAFNYAACLGDDLTAEDSDHA